ncbi:MAG: hypothetical protein IJV35_01410 [Neisseriaceae bacterium]|nr:hypothetical protein [Neisseriaceae bacterium]
MDLAGLFFLILLAIVFILPLASIIWLIVAYVRYKKYKNQPIDDDEMLEYEVRKTQWHCALGVFLGFLWCIGLIVLISIFDKYY